MSRTVPYDLSAVGPRQATDIIKLASARAMEAFIQRRLPDRFTGYAMRVLGYSVAPETWAKKRRFQRYNPEAIKPNVYTGRTKREVLANSRAQTTAVGGARSMKVATKFIHPRVPHGRTVITEKVLQTIVANEAMEMAEVFFTEIMAMAQTIGKRNVVTRNGKISVRSSVTPAVAQQFGRANRATSSNTRSSGVANAG